MSYWQQQRYTEYSAIVGSAQLTFSVPRSLKFSQLKSVPYHFSVANPPHAPSAHTLSSPAQTSLHEEIGSMVANWHSLQCAAHEPLSQPPIPSVIGQFTPHAPQFSGSLRVSTQTPSHNSSPGGQPPSPSPSPSPVVSPSPLVSPSPSPALPPSPSPVVSLPVESPAGTQTSPTHAKPVRHWPSLHAQSALPRTHSSSAQFSKPSRSPIRGAEASSVFACRVRIQREIYHTSAAPSTTRNEKTC